MIDPAELNATNVQISTASLSVRTLTLKGKQMTLSVFRQVREEDLLRMEDGHRRYPLVPLQFYGDAWGWVNYCQCSRGADHHHRHHRHVIWIDNGMIRKARVDIPDALHWRAGGSPGETYGPPKWWTYATARQCQTEVESFLDGIPQLFIAI